MIVQTDLIPYYAVIFTSIRTSDNNGYNTISDRMVELARQQPGFIGVESVRDYLGITISYWKNLESIKKWKNNSEHVIARERGRKEWYSDFKVRIAKVEREYHFKK